MLTSSEREARNLLIGARVLELQARYFGPLGKEYLDAAERLRGKAYDLGYR